MWMVTHRPGPQGLLSQAELESLDILEEEPKV